MGLRPLGQVEEQQYHLEALTFFTLCTLHNDATTIDVDRLIPSRPCLGQTHLHANFSPFRQVGVGQESETLGTQRKTAVKNGSLAGALTFQLRIENS